MGNKSFYDLDYIIELNEQRLEQYANALQKNTEKFTTLLVMYSALCIFLVPFCQKLFIEQVKCDWQFYWGFYLFVGAFGVSVIFSVLLLMPEKLRMLPEPQFYYRYIKFVYAQEGFTSEQIDIIIKANYIEEQENDITKKLIKLLRKNTFYTIAFHFATLACIPYLYCIWIYINLEKNNKKQTNPTSVSVILPKPIICGEENQSSKKSMTWRLNALHTNCLVSITVKSCR